MKFCTHCGSVMHEVLSFSNDRNERYNKCNVCHNETPKNKLTEKELDERFGGSNYVDKKKHI